MRVLKQIRIPPSAAAGTCHASSSLTSSCHDRRVAAVGSPSSPALLFNPPSSSIVASALSSAARSTTAFSYIIQNPECRQSWMRSFELLAQLSRVTKQRVTPSASDQVALLQAMPNTWVMALLHNKIIKGCFKLTKLSQASAVLLMREFRQSNLAWAALSVLENDLKSVVSDTRATMSNSTAKEVLATYATCARDWASALALVTRQPNLQNSPSAVGLLMGAVGRYHSLQKALEVNVALREARVQMIQMRAAPDWDLTSCILAANVRLLRLSATLPGSAALSNAQALVADCLATGEPLTVELFSPVAEMLIRRSHWQTALETLVDRFNVLDDGLHRHKVGVTQVVLNALQCIDPYYDIAREEFMESMSQLAFARHRDKVQGAGSKGHLMFPSAVHQKYMHYTVPVSKALAIGHPTVRFVHLRFDSLVNKLLSANKVIVVVDTNVLIHCATRNITLRHFLSGVRHTHPHLRDVPDDDFAFVVPNIVFREIRRNIFDRYARKVLKDIVWKRLVAILEGADVLAYASEFPSLAFSLLSKVVMQEVKVSRMSHRAQPHGKKNPDEIIMNLTLWIQFLSRWHVAHRRCQQHNKVSVGAHFAGFTRFHARRFLGVTATPGSDSVLLMTFDRDFSYRADALGVDTFPLYVPVAKRKTIRDERKCPAETTPAQ